MMILLTGAYNVQGEAGFIVQNLDAAVEISSPAFTQMAIDGVFPGLARVFVALALIFSLSLRY